MAQRPSDDESESSALERVRQMAARPGGRLGGRPPQSGDRFYREYLVANFGDDSPKSDNSPRGVRS